MSGTSIAGGKERRVQQRKPRRDGWTDAKRKAFLSHLAATCNVTMSVERVGLSKPGLYALRHRDPEFAELCRVALRTGYDRLEEQLLQHAGAGEHSAETYGASVNDVTIGEPGASGQPFDPKLAMELLRSHRAFQAGKVRGGRIGRAPREEVVERLIKKLDALDRRLSKEGLVVRAAGKSGGADGESEA